jgi:hypothetical protein
MPQTKTEILELLALFWLICGALIYFIACWLGLEWSAIISPPLTIFLTGLLNGRPDD